MHEWTEDQIRKLMVAEIAKISQEAADVFLDRVGPRWPSLSTSPSILLDHAFSWHYTPEGFGFWSDIFKQLPTSFTVTLDDIETMTPSKWLDKVRATAAKS